MIKGHNIIYFGPEKWDGMWRNRHQLMSRLSAQNKVMYVEPRLTFKRLRNLLRDKNKRKELFSTFNSFRVRGISKNLFIYNSPWYVPIFGRSPFRELSKMIWRSIIKKELKKQSFLNPIIFVSRPYMNCYLEYFNERLSIYHVVDEYSAYGELGSEKKLRKRALENILIKKVDIVIVVSRELYTAKEKLANNIYLIPNAVDYKAYESARNNSEPIPADIARLPRPIIGYSGLISTRLNIDLLFKIADNHREWSIVLIGSVSEKLETKIENEINKIENLYYLGLKNINQLPYYIKGFDVCIIPYRLTDETRNLSSLKLYDYFAIGKPIVTTNFPSAWDFKNVIQIADTESDFIKCIEKSLSFESPDKKYLRIKIASENSWEQRVEEISKIIEKHLIN